MRVHVPERSLPGLSATAVLLMIWSIFVLPAWLIGPFLAAGRRNWVTGWAYFAVLAVGLSAHRVYLKRRNPELLNRRRKIGAGSNCGRLRSPIRLAAIARLAMANWTADIRFGLRVLRLGNEREPTLRRHGTNTK